MIIRIEKEKYFKRVYFNCEKCGKETSKSLRVKLEEFKPICKKCNTSRTCLEKYGVDNPAKSEIVQKKVKNTCLAKYGFDNPNKNKNVKEKSKQTCLMKYGVDNPSRAESVKRKREDTFIKKFGVDNPSKASGPKNKSRQTCLERYGSENPFSSKYIQEKARKTLLEKYGAEPFRSEVIRNKSKKTLLNKYGVDSYSKTKEYKEKYKITSLTKYGVDNPAKCPKIIAKCLNTKRKNHTFNSSRPEEKVYEILKSKYPNVIRQYSDKARYPFACDFYISSKDLFIECNFFWTHGKKPFKEPFDKNNPEHAKRLEEWENKPSTKLLYKQAIETWTVRDVLKIKTAKKNKLNYLVLYKMPSDLVETIELYCKDNQKRETCNETR